jgi:5-methylcytosine-specific restriction protein B
MNTTDRSIGLIDAAIRRRFAFKELHPDEPPVRDVLPRYLAKAGVLDDRAALMSELNRRIDERDLRIGPSYLMHEAASKPGGLERVWEYDIIPLLVEHFYDRRDAETVRAEFSLANLRAGIDRR